MIAQKVKYKYIYHGKMLYFNKLLLFYKKDKNVIKFIIYHRHNENILAAFYVRHAIFFPP